MRLRVQYNRSLINSQRTRNTRRTFCPEATWIYIYKILPIFIILLLLYRCPMFSFVLNACARVCSWTYEYTRDADDRHVCGCARVCVCMRVRVARIIFLCALVPHVRAIIIYTYSTGVSVGGRVTRARVQRI